MNQKGIFPVEIIEVIPNKTRVVIQPDADPLNPRTDIESPVGCYHPDNLYWPLQVPPPVYEAPSGLREAHERLWDDARPLDPERLVTRWASIHYGLAMEWDLGSYWFCDRLGWDMLIGREFSVENQREVIHHEVEAWKRYCRNEAKIVTLERRSTFKRVKPSKTDESDLLHVWEKVDDIADVYLDEYGGSWARVVTDHLNHMFTNKERTVFQAILDSEPERSLSHV
jgi:hypothetical protein